MGGRHYYTPAGFAAMKEDLARSLIGMRFRSFDVIEGEVIGFNGSPDEGWQSPRSGPGSNGVIIYRFPPVPGRGGSTGTVPYAFDSMTDQPLPDATIDVHEVMYQPWFDAVDSAFAGWDELPDERDFWARGDALSHGGHHIRLQRYTAEVGADVGPVNETLDISVEEINTLLSRGATNGRAIEAFRTGYALPLPALLAQQHTLLVALSQLVKAEGDLWHQARTKVMEIGHGARQAADETDAGDTRAVLSILGILAGVAANVPGPQQVPAALVSGGIALINQLWPATPEDDVPLELAADTPGGVVDNVVAALQTLNRQIADEETAIAKLAGDVDDASRTPSTVSAADQDPGTPVKYEIYFDLPSPVILAETDRVDLAINPDTLRYVANDHLPTVASAVANTAAQTDFIDLAEHAWTRPASIGSGSNGPYAPVESLRQRVVELLTNTGGELTAASGHLRLAVDLIVRADGAAQEALDAHATQVQDQGLPQPEVTDPPDPVPGTELPITPDQQDPSERPQPAVGG